MEWEQRGKKNAFGLMGSHFHAKRTMGWGLLNVEQYGKSLLLKSRWRSFQLEGIWSDIIRFKYLKNQDLEDAFLGR